MPPEANNLQTPQGTPNAADPNQDPTPQDTPLEPQGQPAGDGITLISANGEEFQLPPDTRIRLKYKKSPLDLPLNEARDRFQEGYHNQTKAEQIAAERKTWEEQATEYQNYMHFKGWLDNDPEAYQVIQLMATGQVRPQQLLQRQSGPPQHQQPPSQPYPGTPPVQDDMDSWFEGPGAQQNAPYPGAPGTPQPVQQQPMPPAYLDPIMRGMNHLLDKVNALETAKEQETREARERAAAEQMNRQAEATVSAIEKSKLPTYFGGLDNAVDQVGNLLKSNPEMDPLLAVRTLESQLEQGTAARYQEYLNSKAQQAQRQSYAPGFIQQPHQVPDLSQLPQPKPGDLLGGQTRRNVATFLRKFRGG